jgi:hypothetical protein
MKTLISILLLITTSVDFKPSAETVTGTWKCVRARYGTGEMENRTDDVYKMFTATRWSAAFYNKHEKKFNGAGGGTYTLKGDQYTEVVDYYSWEPEAAGKTFRFVVKIENGMLHQTGTIAYKGDLNYTIDEWYQRVD